MGINYGGVMKDLSHHRGHLQRKVIQEAKKEAVDLKENKPLKLRHDHEVPYWEPKDEALSLKKAEDEAKRDAIRETRVAKVRKERKVLAY
jgi:hypothetical protein